MTELQTNALSRVPMTRGMVEDIYTGRSFGTDKQRILALCESHERLQMELDGAMLLVAQGEEKAQALLAKALALTDTGSDAFRKAFPPDVPGWRVVEKIREILLGGGEAAGVRVETA